MTRRKFDLLPDSFGAMLVAAGTEPGATLFKEIAHRSHIHIALDGGVALYKRHHIPPDYVIGDMDSASETLVSWAKKIGAKIKKVNSQLDSDLEKGLAFCRSNCLKHLAILASDGDRPDHTLYAIDAAFRYLDLQPVLILGKSITYLLRNQFQLHLHVPLNHTISWLGWPRAESCTISGVRWPFRNRIIQTGGFQSLSNLANRETISISSRKGQSLLILSLTPEKKSFKK